jgi:crotonobetainyl-CoA:carnitine CoA-transferase CaiB-like acyl-CoA transferase
MTSPSPAALDHLRVLDLASHLGQTCGRSLGDLGADVIKVEPPEGDSTRRMGSFAGDQADPERSLRFINANRSKRSIVLDLNVPERRERVRALAERADILVEDFARGYLTSLGLGYEDLQQVNPGLVYVSITPFGQTGPHADYRGGDLIAQATSGIMIAKGDDEMRLCMAPYEIIFQVTCAQAAFGALLAIRAWKATGQGQHVDVSRQEGTISAEHPYIYRYSHENVITRPEGRQSPLWGGEHLSYLGWRLRQHLRL